MPFGKWFITNFTDSPRCQAYVIIITTDDVAHLWLRYSFNKPQKHPKGTVLRGLPVMGDVYYCFTAFTDIEQEEAGDTLTHTFIITPIVTCSPFWFYFHGTVAGAVSPSTSAIFGRHLTTKVYAHTFPIIHVNDDALLGLGNIWACPSMCPTVLMTGRYQTEGQKIGACLRFRSLTIPQYSCIDYACLHFTARYTDTTLGIKTQIWAEQVDDPPDFSGETFDSAWARQANSGIKVNWDLLPAWYLDLVYPSIDICQVIEQVVNRPGYQTGNPIVLFWNDYAHRSVWIPMLLRRAWPYNQAPAKTVSLYVEYTVWSVEAIL